jgi:SAM-dependent methyltransferase
VVEIGCGVGDRLRALSPRVEAVVGLDASGVMAAEARERTAGLGNVIVLQTSGRDLSMIDDRAADLVLAVDGFPDGEGAGLASVHVREAARVLRPGGELVGFGWSGRGDDTQEEAACAEAAGLTLVTAGARPLGLCDGVLHRFRR